MSPEEILKALDKMAEKHPQRRLADAIAKARIDGKVNQLRQEIRYRPVRTAAQREMLAGITEGLV